MEDLNIHKTAVVHPSAKLSPGVSIGPYSVVDGDVVLGDSVRIGSHCVITGQTSIGEGCKVYTGAVIGSIPQDKKFQGDENVFLRIGPHNVIREYVTINTGTVNGGGKTVLGAHNLLMAYSHVAHDCIIGNHCVMANSATLAGHVTLEDNAVVGGLTAIHQFVRLGRLSMVGGCSKVVQDIPPFSICDGHPTKVFGVNITGLKRASFPSNTAKELKKAFKIIFNSGLTKTHAIERVEKEMTPCPEIEHLVFFIKTSQRGLCS